MTSRWRAAQARNGFRAAAVVVADGHHIERFGGQQLRQRVVTTGPGGIAILEDVGLGFRVGRFGGDGHQFHIRQLGQDAEDLLGVPVKAGQRQANLARKTHLGRGFHLGHQGAGQRPGQ